jgi:hypothetical protein
MTHAVQLLRQSKRNTAISTRVIKGMNKKKIWLNLPKLKEPAFQTVTSLGRRGRKLFDCRSEQDFTLTTAMPILALNPHNFLSKV